MPVPPNGNDPDVLFCDMNACFASSEQQANPLWRGKPVGITPVNVPGSCVISPSYELKARGVKTGMSNRDARLMAPDMVLKVSDTDLYREMHRRLNRILRDFSPDVRPLSVDEAAVFLAGTPALRTRSMESIALELKARVKKEMGPAMRVSVGIATNVFLAKTAASLDKPDGLRTIRADNLRDVLAGLKLTDLCGIAGRYEARLNAAGIFTTLDFMDADAHFLCKSVFGSIEGYYWFRKLRGYEEKTYEPNRGSYGNSVQLDKPTWQIDTLMGIAEMLCLKASTRMRREGYRARNVQLMLRYEGGGWFKRHARSARPLWTAPDVFRAAVAVFNAQSGGGGRNNPKGVTKVMVDLYDLAVGAPAQLGLFDGECKGSEIAGITRDKRITESLDVINLKYGPNTLRTARMVGANIEANIHDRIPFGSVSDVEELYAEEEEWEVPNELAKAAFAFGN